MAHRDDRIQVKGFLAKNNTTFKLNMSWVINVAACTNGNICIEGGRIRYLIPVCGSQSEITRTTCICLLQDQTLTEFTIVSNTPTSTDISKIWHNGNVLNIRNYSKIKGMGTPHILSRAYCPILMKLVPVRAGRPSHLRTSACRARTEMAEPPPST